VSNQPEWFDDLPSSEEDMEYEYAFCVPLKESGIAYLIKVHQDVLIKVSQDGYWYTESNLVNNLRKYLNEIKSGDGNWIIDPLHDNSDLKWSELDYANAAVVKRMVKVTKEYNYEVVK
jgi:hypothetical protein